MKRKTQWEVFLERMDALTFPLTASPPGVRFTSSLTLGRSHPEGQALHRKADHQVKEHEAGAKVADLTRRHGFSEQSFYRWKSECGGMEVSEAKRLRELEAENARLNRLLAEAERDKAALKDVIGKKW